MERVVFFCADDRLGRDETFADVDRVFLPEPPELPDNLRLFVVGLLSAGFFGIFLGKNNLGKAHYKGFALLFFVNIDPEFNL